MCVARIRPRCASLRDDVDDSIFAEFSNAVRGVDLGSVDVNAATSVLNRVRESRVKNDIRGWYFYY